MGLEVVARVAAALLDVRPDDPSTGLTRLLEALSQALRSGSAALYRIDRERGIAVRLAAVGAFRAPSDEYPLGMFPELTRRTLDGQPVVYGIDDLDPTSSVRVALESLGFSRGLLLPMVGPDAVWGLLSFWWQGEPPALERSVDALMTISALVAQTMRWLASEQERRQITAWFRLYAEASSEGIAIHENGVFVDVNEPAQRLLRARREDLVGQPILKFSRPEDHALVIDRVRSGVEGSIEIEVLRLDGTPVWCELDVRQAVVDGATYRMIVVRDITGRVRDRAIQARALQAQRLEGLGLLASGIAHDFNNLLVGVLGNAELLEAEADLDATAMTAVSRIREAAMRASGLTGQLLAYAGKGPLQVAELDLDTRIRDLHVARRSGVDVRVELHGALPSVSIDGSQIDQVVMNLVTNAIEAVGEVGTVHVSTAVRTVSDAEGADPLNGPLPPGTHVVLEVRDSGPGMDPETAARVFDPFFSSKAEGRGLGLAAVHGIVHQHGGLVEVHSARGEGAVFRVYLPGGASPAAPAGEPVERVAGSTRARVLLVDDDDAVRRVARRLLEVTGFDVVEAADGESALDRIGAEHFDVVMLDLSMPGMGGEQVFRRVRELKPEQPVVICSGAMDARSFAGRPHVVLLAKPYRRTQLQAALESVLSP
ncbi:MAG: response regulator [Alphaproteobacteria bacterium]|nr:response regulator [Alphaproteobacteria bacterium]